MDKESLLLAIENSTTSLVAALSTFTTAQINQTPSVGGWSVAQIAEHLLLAEASCLQAITAPGSASTRPPAEKIPMIQFVMENRAMQFPSPANLMPVSFTMEVETLLNQLLAQREKIKKAIMQVEILEANLQAKHPGFGTLTKLEWGYFIVFHSNRHTQQILAFTMV